MPSERFLFLEKTLQEIDELTTEFDKSASDLEDSKNHLNEIISDIENTKSKLLYESEVCQDFDAKKQKLENEILLEIEKFEQANFSMRDHANSKLSGLSMKKFRKENLLCWANNSLKMDKTQQHQVLIVAI